MDIDRLRKLCLSFPGATEQVQWENNLLFKVGGRMFAITSLEPARVWLTIKADPEEFAELTERAGIIPAPYLARAKWISIESAGALPQSELEALLHKSYELVRAKLSRASLAKLSSANRAKPKAKGRRSENT